MAGPNAKLKARVARLESIAMGAGLLLQKLRYSYGNDFGIGMTEQVDDCIRDIKQIENDVMHKARLEASRAAQQPAQDATK